MAACIDLSTWRNFSKSRVPTRPVGRPRKNPEFNMFYGYPADLIAEWCCVAISTAFAYKSGRLKLSKPAAELFRLRRDRLVLTREWRGWLVTPNAIIDPDGHETPRGLLHNHSLMLQCYRELAVRTEEEQKIARWRSLLEAGEWGAMLRFVRRVCPAENGAAPRSNTAGLILNYSARPSRRAEFGAFGP